MIEIRIKHFKDKTCEYEEDFVFKGKKYRLETLLRSSYKLHYLYKKVLDISENTVINAKSLLKRLDNLKQQAGVKFISRNNTTSAEYSLLKIIINQ